MKSLIIKCRDFATKHSFWFTCLLCLTLVVVLALGFLTDALLSLNDRSREEVLAQLKNDGKFMSRFESNPLELTDPYLAYDLSCALKCRVDQLSKEKMAKVKDLNVRGNPYIESLEDLKWFTSLESLTVTDCRVTEASAVFTIKSLKILDLSDNCIETVKGIENLKMLEKLNLSGNAIQDVSEVSSLSLLKEADLSQNMIYQAPDVSEIPELAELDLAENHIDSLSFMKGNKCIVSLDISSNVISDLTDLSGCNNLEKLYLYRYSSMDLSPLKQLEKFNSIYLSQDFDRSKIDFMINNFANGDQYTRIYLVSKARGLEVND